MTCEEIFVKKIGVKNWMLLWLVVNSSILTPNYFIISPFYSKDNYPG